MTSRRVLAVDDERVVRPIVRRPLEEGDYRVCGAQDGEEALELPDSKGADGVLLDLQTPWMSGKTPYHSMPSRWTRLSDTTIVMSGDPEAPDVAEWTAVHGMSVPATPFGRAALLEASHSLPETDRRRIDGRD